MTEEEKKPWDKRSMIWEIENEENPYRKIFIMRKWHNHLIAGAMENTMLEERLMQIRMDTAYMITNLPTLEDFNRYLEDKKK